MSIVTMKYFNKNKWVRIFVTVNTITVTKTLITAETAMHRKSCTPAVEIRN